MDKTNDNKLTGIKKRQQIASANKMIFIWVAAAAVAVSFCAIALQFLVREGLFNQKIIDAKGETNRTLENNLAAVSPLKKNVEALLANENLQAARHSETTNNLQVVLDALPVSGDPTAFASSMQERVFLDSGIQLMQLSVTGAPVAADVGAAVPADDPAAIATPGAPAVVQELGFTAGLKGSYSQMRSALAEIARVIRPINLTRMSITGADSSLQLTIEGKTYYLPAKTVELQSKSIEP